MNSKVSVVMATYNGAKYIRQQLDSIIAQTYPIYEIIVQDDGSSDSTIDILNEYSEKYDCFKVFVNDTRLGFRDNFLTACQRAAGDFIALSDQDDIWLDNHIEVLMNSIGDNLLVCGDSLFVDKDAVSMNFTFSDEKTMNNTDIQGDRWLYRILWGSGPFQGAAMLMKRDFAQRVLDCPDGVTFHDGWFSFCAAVFGGMKYLHRVVLYYRQHGGNVTNHSKHSIIRELNRHTHFDFMPDRVLMINSLKSNPSFTTLNMSSRYIMDEFEKYSHRCKHFRYRLWCWRFRSRHYREIYSDRSPVHYLMRCVHYILTPSNIK